MVLLFAPASFAVTLAWDPSPDPTVVGFNLYYGPAAGTYTNKTDTSLVTSYTLSGFRPGVTYYFVLTAYNSAGLESDPSNEVSYTPPVTNRWQLVTPGGGPVFWSPSILGPFTLTNLAGPLLLEDPDRLYWRGATVTNWVTVDGIYQPPAPAPPQVLSVGVRFEDSEDLATWSAREIWLLTLTNPPGRHFYRATAVITNGPTPPP